MSIASQWRVVLVLAFAASAGTTVEGSDATRKTAPQNIRCAVIGGMMDTGFWPALSKRFEASTGHVVQVVAQGPKQVIGRAFIDGQADLITMHASDTVINLVADGYGVDPQPWAKNDLVIVGPRADPAGIRGMTDAAEALRKIIETKSNLLIHRSLGAQEVLSNLMAAAHVEPDPQHTIVRLEHREPQMLLLASQERAYTVAGRIPFLSGKIPNRDLLIMVQGDPRLRRPYVVVVASPSRVSKAQSAAARQLADYLRKPETQAWISEYGRGKLDDHPLFFPVTIPGTGGPSPLKR
jgi:tungstate transport system substrate-binding protein